MFDKLTDSLRGSLKKIRDAVFVDDSLINEIVRDVQRSLLSADVNVKLVMSLTQKIKERIRSEPPKGLTKKDYFVTVLYEELASFLGGEGAKITISKKPFTIMLVGLFGNGKTTTAGKLAKYYQKRGLKVAMLSTDTWRPAAAEQLLQLGKQIGVPTFGNPKEKDPVKIFKTYVDELRKADVIIVDTAGRDALNDELVGEVKSITKAVQPDEVLLVMAADVGQSAEKQAQMFHEACGVTGVVITKLDGTAKGGGALSACAVTQAPVKFIGVGEKIDALEEFKPKNFVGRLLGMGDLETLLEKAKEAISEEDAQQMQKRLIKGDFTLIDLYQQMEAMKKMGPLQKVMEMIPGMGQMQIPKEALAVQQEKLEVWKIAMDSMTREELQDPEVLNPSRITRISRGAGVSERDIKDLAKQHKQSKKLLKVLKGRGSEKDMQKMMKKMQGMMRR
jgi:signal recognition particle subunit SRP54